MGLFHIRSASTAGKVPRTGLCTRRVHFGQILIDMSGHSTARVVYSAQFNKSEFRGGNAMDISYNCENQKFNYRVCAMIIAENKILAMHDERSPYFYLPGGRVKMGETAEQAVVREIQEELGVTPKITRPLWLNQAFFTEDVDNLHYHELCIYFLVDISETTLLERGNVFTLTEGKHIHTFEWLEFDRLKDEYFYPLFLKKAIYDLPDEFTLRTELE